MPQSENAKNFSEQTVVDSSSIISKLLIATLMEENVLKVAKKNDFDTKGNPTKLQFLPLLAQRISGAKINSQTPSKEQQSTKYIFYERMMYGK